MTDQPPELDLVALLDALENRLRAADALIVSHWRPGANRAQVEHAFHSLGLQAPDDIITWYRWHDGTDATPPGQKNTHRTASILLGGWVAYTLDQAMDRRRSDWALYHEVGLPDIDEMETWFPLLGLDSTAALLCVDCAPERATPSPIYILDPWGGDWPSCEPRYPSLAHFVAEAVRLFDEGLTRPDPHRLGAIEFDHRRVTGGW